MLNFIPIQPRAAGAGDGSPLARCTPEPLFQHGVMFPVTISTAQLSAANGPSFSTNNRMVLGLLDTGCTITSIDKRLAAELRLTAIGRSRFLTAAGERVSENYIVDLTFPENTLKPFLFQQIGSCDLQYTSDVGGNAPPKFGLLIGRDMMTRWHITWNGAISAVCISD